MRARTYADSAALSEALNPLMDAVLHARTMATAPATYYEPPDREHLFNLDVDAAVLSHLEDDYDTPEDFPETMTINRFRRMVPKARSFRHPNHLSPLTEILERLDEDHADPEGPATDATPVHAPRRSADDRDRTAGVQPPLVRGHQQPHGPRTNLAGVPLPGPDAHTVLPEGGLRPLPHHTRRAGDAQLHRLQEKGLQPLLAPRPIADPTPWEIRSRRYGCAFRLTDEQEKDKIRREYQNHTEHVGWGFRPEGPVHAE